MKKALKKHKKWKSK